MKAVILTGGKGTRLGSLNLDIPKPLVPVGDIPILGHQINLLKQEGIQDIYILTGYLGDKIEQYIQENDAFGLNIQCIRESEPLGTAGCVSALKDEISEDFFLLYGDVMMEMDLESLGQYHQEKQGIATLVIHPNDHPYDSDLVKVDDQMQIVQFLPKHERTPDMDYDNLVNAAVYVLSPQVFQYIPTHKSDFVKDVFPAAMANAEVLYGYKSAEYMKDMGTPDRLELVNRHYREGIIHKKSRKVAKGAIFLDRDGTINQEVGLVSDPNQITLMPQVAEAIRMINGSEYLAVCVTNQPVIARNLCSFETLHQVHQRMEKLLGEAHAYLDEIYFCPHHPDKGYPEERVEYKISCECRKPEPGMLQQAQRELNIDLSRSYMIGDRTSDIEAGRRCGVTTILLQTGAAGKDGKCDITPDHVFADLWEAIHFILKTSQPE